jgi:phage tail sheath protein FI
MATYKRPGVYVEESLLQTTPDSFPAITVAAFVGVSTRGPVQPGTILGLPTLINSWGQFVKLYGGFAGANQALAHAVFQYYNNGGQAAYIVRAVGAGAVVATRTYNDRAGTPAPLLRVDALNPGAWGNVIYTEISDVGSSLPGRFNLTVRLGGSGDQFIVERWTDLSMDPTDGRYAPALLNSPTTGSVYIRLTNLSSATYVAGTIVPAVSPAGGEVLTSGADGAAPTVGAGSELYNAAATLALVDDFLTINIPGVVDTATVNAMITFCETRGTCFLVVDCAVAQTPAQLITTAAAYTSSSYAAVYYPQLAISDPSNTVPGSTRLIPPGGAVVGQYVATDTQRGTHKAPAGINNRLNGVVALEYRALESEMDSLNMGKVNVIKSVPGNGLCIFGARTLKLNQIDKYVSVRRTLIALRMALTNATRFAAFESNDEQLWASLEDVCSRVLLELWQDGALRGTTAEEAFYVKCDEDTNAQNAVNNGEVHIEVGVALETPAEFIVLKIGQFESGSTVNEEV